LPGEPRRQRFDSEYEAKQTADRYREQWSTSKLAAFTLTPRQREDALAALKLIDGVDVTLEAAAKFYMAHNFPAGGERTVAELVTEFLAFKTGRQRRRGRTISDYRARLAQFTAVFGNRPIKSITATEIDEWLNANLSREAITQEGYHRVLNTFFNYAKGTRDRKGKFTAKPYRLDNPMDQVPRPEPVEKLPGRCLTVEEATKLLDAASETQSDFGLLPYTALGLFCGIRREELQKLQWRHVNVPAGIVTIDAATAKAGFHRHVPIPDNARLWLASAGLPGPEAANDAVVPAGFEKRWQRVRERAGMFADWPANALRHSFGSYACDRFGEEETRRRMGHRTPEILIRHYRTLVLPGQGERYFTLMPPTSASNERVEPFGIEAAAG
jgi:integrase